jgi:transposase
MSDGKEDQLEGWLREAHRSDLSEIRTFAKGVCQDEAAVRAAISLPWSSGLVEGHANRLKLVERQMYGRANFDLLRRRALRAA